MSVVSQDGVSVPAGWIGGRRFDLVFFFGSTLVGVLAGALALAAPALVLPIWWAFLLLVDGPHLVATYLRTYLDPDERRARGPLLLGSLAWLVPGFVAWAAMRATGVRAPFDLFLIVAGLWSLHHAVRQYWGILAIYQHHAKSSSAARRADWWFLHGALWVAFGLFSFGHPWNRALLRIPEPAPAWMRALGIGAAVILALGTVSFVVYRLLRFRGEPTRPLWFLLGPAIGLQTFAMFVIGAFEPLVPHPTNPEAAFLATAVVGGIVHGMHYLGIVSAVSQRRHASGGRHIAARLGRRPLVAYGVLVAVSLVYVALNAARGVVPVPAFFPQKGAAVELFLVLYWGIFFHHFYLDQRIWRVRGDRRLRFELGLEARS
jgi:hypothetical protein